MPHLAHFAINADDVARARRFYERVFGWKFNAWGPPGFYQIDMGAGAPAAVHRRARRDGASCVKGQPTIGYECTISVSSIDETVRKPCSPTAARRVLEKSVIVGVGALMFFQDPEGNAFGAIQFDKQAE